MQRQKKFFHKYWDIILHPSQFFDELPQEENYSDPIKFYLVSCGLFLLLLIIFSPSIIYFLIPKKFICLGSVILYLPDVFKRHPFYFSSICRVILVILIIILLLLPIESSLVHLLVTKFTGKKDYKQTFRIIAYINGAIFVGGISLLLFFYLCKSFVEGVISFILFFAYMKVYVARKGLEKLQGLTLTQAMGIGCLTSFFAIVIIIFFLGPSNYKLQRKIGDYYFHSATDESSSFNWDKKNEDKIIFIRVYYFTDQSQSTQAIVDIETNPTEEIARIRYDMAKERISYEECKIRGIIGIVKSSNGCANFKWNEGQINKEIFISRKRGRDRNSNSIEEQCMKDLFLFIDAFKNRKVVIAKKNLQLPQKLFLYLFFYLSCKHL